MNKINYAKILDERGQLSKPLPISAKAEDIILANGKSVEESVTKIETTYVPSTGNIESASRLETPRKINGVDFDGSADITITANANDVKDWAKAEVKPNYDYSEIKDTPMIPEIYSTTENSINNTIEGKLRINYIEGKTEQVVPTGKNLFNINEIKTSKTYKVLNNALVITNSLYTNVGLNLISLCPKLIAGKTYTLSAESTGTLKYCYLSATQRNWNFGESLVIQEADLNSVMAFYGTKEGEVTISSIQIEEGDKQTFYEPYIGEGSLPNPDFEKPIKVSKFTQVIVSDKDNINKKYAYLPEITLPKKNIIHVKDGSWIIEGHRKLRTFDGSADEKWDAWGNKGIWSISLEDASFEKTENMISNRFEYKENMQADPLHPENGYMSEDENMRKFFCLTSVHSVDEFRTWLSTHPLVIEYDSTFTIPIENWNLDTLQTFSGQTNITTNSEIQPIINWEYTKEKFSDRVLKNAETTNKDIANWNQKVSNKEFNQYKRTYVDSRNKEKGIGYFIQTNIYKSPLSVRDNFILSIQGTGGTASSPEEWEQLNTNIFSLVCGEINGTQIKGLHFGNNVFSVIVSDVNNYLAFWIEDKEKESIPPSLNFKITTDIGMPSGKNHITSCTREEIKPPDFDRDPIVFDEVFHTNRSPIKPIETLSVGESLFNNADEIKLIKQNNLVICGCHGTTKQGLAHPIITIAELPLSFQPLDFYYCKAFGINPSTNKSEVIGDIVVNPNNSSIILAADSDIRDLSERDITFNFSYFTKQ